MVQGLHYFQAAEHGYPVEPGEEPPKEITDAFAVIQSLYDAGTPLYTKEAIRDVWQQLESCRADGYKIGQKVSVKALNGENVDFEIQTGRVLRAENPNEERIIGDPIISYCTYESLVSPRFNYMPRLAYTNLVLNYHLHFRNKTTKELVDPDPPHASNEVEDYFKKMQSEWEASEPCKQLRSTLASIEIPHVVTKIVCFALSSVVYNFEDHRHHESVYQHAMVLTVLEELKKKQNQDDIKCYAQDPIYTELDKSILNELGIVILNDPQGFLEVDNSALVVSCSANVPVKEIVLDIARPAMMIWDRPHEHEPGTFWTDPYSSRTKERIYKFYDEAGFPGDKDQFGDLGIFIKRKGEA